MLYPVYKNGPFVTIPIHNILITEWKVLKETERNNVIKDFKFDPIIPPNNMSLCLIDIREGNNIFFINPNDAENIYIHKSIKRPFKFDSEPYELILYRESIELIKIKGREYIKNMLINNLFSLLNDKLNSKNITLELHTALLKDYKDTINVCILN
jgi:hypothetical protein